jgi:hypothetical protein
MASEDKYAAINATLRTQYKIRLYGQFFVLKKLDKPIHKMEKDDLTGIVVPVVEEYQHLPGKQFVTNYNGLGMSREEFEHQWVSLGERIWEEMKSKDVTK